MDESKATDLKNDVSNAILCFSLTQSYGHHICDWIASSETLFEIELIKKLINALVIAKTKYLQWSYAAKFSAKPHRFEPNYKSAKRR